MLPIYYLPDCENGDGCVGLHLNPTPAPPPIICAGQESQDQVQVDQGGYQDPLQITYWQFLCGVNSTLRNFSEWICMVHPENPAEGRKDNEQCQVCQAEEQAQEPRSLSCEAPVTPVPIPIEVDPPPADPQPCYPVDTVLPQPPPPADPQPCHPPEVEVDPPPPPADPHPCHPCALNPPVPVQRNVPISAKAKVPAPASSSDSLATCVVHLRSACGRVYFDGNSRSVMLRQLCACSSCGKDQFEIVASCSGHRDVRRSRSCATATCASAVTGIGTGTSGVSSTIAQLRSCLKKALRARSTGPSQQQGGCEQRVERVHFVDCRCCGNGNGPPCRRCRPPSPVKSSTERKRKPQSRRRKAGPKSRLRRSRRSPATQCHRQRQRSNSTSKRSKRSKSSKSEPEAKKVRSKSKSKAKPKSRPRSSGCGCKPSKSRAKRSKSKSGNSVAEPKSKKVKTKSRPRTSSRRRSGSGSKSKSRVC